MSDMPRCRAIVDGLLVKFESRNPNLASVRWHPRFKLRYRTKSDALKAKEHWETKHRILFPEDLAAMKPDKKSTRTYQQRASQAEMCEARL
jgi:hypothetical protein